MLPACLWVNPRGRWPISLNRCVWSVDRRWARVVYAHARTYIRYGRTQVLMIKL
nr:MAG TPA: hypothetical protein [Caudoviricetes sp.]